VSIVSRCELHTVEAPRSRPRTRSELAARKALDTWSGTQEANVAIAIEEGYVDGLKRAAAFVEGRRDRDLAMAIRRLAEEHQNRP
jgi:hypothetical protein